MLSSLILSLVMSSTPAATNVNDFTPEVVGTKRGTVRIGTKRGTVRIGTKRGTVRIDSKNTPVDEVGTKRGTVRIQETTMINLIKSLFVTEKTENTIAAGIEIKEMPASTWWN